MWRIIGPVKVRQKRADDPDDRSAEPPACESATRQTWQEEILSIVCDGAALYHAAMLSDVRIKRGAGALQLDHRPVHCITQH